MKRYFTFVLMLAFMAAGAGVADLVINKLPIPVEMTEDDNYRANYPMSFDRVLPVVQEKGDINGDTEVGLPDVTALARSGDLQATYELGVEYYNGAIGGEHPEWAAKAKSLLEKAAFEGDIAGAYYHLSLCYQNEVGCDFNLEKATEMACKGADLGMIESKFEAARLILQGDYDPFMAHKAFTYAHDAAQEDYPEAWYLYGMICKHGIGTTADSVAGQEWIDKAEAAGYTLED